MLNYGGKSLALESEFGERNCVQNYVIIFALVF